MCWLRELPGNNKKKGVFPSQSVLDVCEYQTDNSSKKKKHNSPPQMTYSTSVAAETSAGFIYVGAQNEAGLFSYCRYRTGADFSWKDCSLAKSAMKYSSYEGIDLARFDYCQTVRKRVAEGTNKQTNKHMLILLLVSGFLYSFLEWVL